MISTANFIIELHAYSAGDFLNMLRIYSVILEKKYYLLYFIEFITAKYICEIQADNIENKYKYQCWEICVFFFCKMSVQWCIGGTDITKKYLKTLENLC